MVKVVSLKKTTAEKAVEKKALGTSTGAYEGPDSDGASVHLDHDHLTKMGHHGNLKSGDKLEMTARGYVESSESRSGKDGERHTARIRLTHMGIDHKPQEDREEMRRDVESSYDTAEKKRAEGAKLAAGRSGKEVAEKY
jgi:hypothetical protein